VSHLDKNTLLHARALAYAQRASTPSFNKRDGGQRRALTRFIATLDALIYPTPVIQTEDIDEGLKA
jgi:hypothetical protein